MDNDSIKHSHQINFDEQLLLSIEQGENERVVEILRSSDLYNATDASGATLLHYSARYGNKIILQLLLENNCNVNAQDAMGNTPLMVATEENKLEIVQLLLDNKTDIFLMNSEKKNVLHILCTNHQIRTGICKLLLCEFRKRCCSSEEAAQKLIEAGFDLYFAAYSLDCKIIKYMIERGYSVNSIHPIQKVTALHVAVRFADSDSVKILLEHGADPNALNYVYAKPLYYLYRDGKKNNLNKIEILKAFLNLKISLASCSFDGRFDIGYALIDGDREAIRLLLQSKLDFTMRDNIYGRTVMHYFAQNFNPEVDTELNTIVGMRYHANVLDKHGHSPLSLAAFTGNVNMVRYLLLKGAEPNVKHWHPLYYVYLRSTPEHKARYDQCANLLLEHELDFESILLRRNGEDTLFNFVRETNDVDRMKPVLVQLLLREKSGSHISKKIRSTIESDTSLRKHFNEYEKLIGKKIYGAITFCKLLTCHRKKMERYLNNGKLFRKIKLFNKKHKIKSRHPYLFNRWRKQYLTGKEFKKLRDGAVGPLCKIFGDCIDKNHFIINKIIDYLDIQSLAQLARL